ncbi:MAG: hypothetical protein JWP81_5049 [Ferruginibacter sp.]|nr:hypothetical protein [Ferruginibacter sp.]
MENSYTTQTTTELTEAGKPKLPSGLNVLTILTFIGCGIGLLFTLLTPVINKFFLGFMEKAQTSGRELSAKELADMEKGKNVILLSQANMVPLMIVGIISIALCIVGAIWMRKLKKDGFWIYTGGELLPVIGSFIILGMGQFTGVVSVIFAVGIPVLFVILYAMQRKYLVN